MILHENDRLVGQRSIEPAESGSQRQVALNSKRFFPPITRGQHIRFCELCNICVEPNRSSISSKGRVIQKIHNECHAQSAIQPIAKRFNCEWHRFRRNGLLHAPGQCIVYCVLCAFCTLNLNAAHILPFENIYIIDILRATQLLAAPRLPDFAQSSCPTSIIMIASFFLQSIFMGFFLLLFRRFASSGSVTCKYPRRWLRSWWAGWTLRSQRFASQWDHRDQ